jgi:hypothetical protein
MSPKEKTLKNEEHNIADEMLKNLGANTEAGKSCEEVVEALECLNKAAELLDGLGDFGKESKVVTSVMEAVSSKMG